MGSLCRPRHEAILTAGDRRGLVYGGAGLESCSERCRGVGETAQGGLAPELVTGLRVGHSDHRLGGDAGALEAGAVSGLTLGLLPV